jgi:peptidyl-prolyl cis-trans isomerase C
MKQTVRHGLFFVMVSVGLAACRHSHGPAVAQVGSIAITAEDLRSRLNDAPAAYQQYVATEEGRKQFLNLLIREKILLSEANRLHISSDPAYKKALDQYKREWARRLHDFEDTLQVESVIRRLRSKDLAVTDTEVQKYFNDHREEFEKPVSIMASHILLSTEADAQTALARLKNKEPFEKVARAMSKDPATASRGGKLTPFKRGTLVPEFEAAAFVLKNGQVSGIVKTQFGFHIIKKLGQTTLPAQSFSAVSEEIRAKLERDKFNQWIAAKQSVVGVKIYEQAMSRVPLEEPPNHETK